MSLTTELSQLQMAHASGNLYTLLPTNLNLPAERIHVAASFTREIAQVEGFTIPDFPPLQF